MFDLNETKRLANILKGNTEIPQLHLNVFIDWCQMYGVATHLHKLIGTYKAHLADGKQADEFMKTLVPKYVNLEELHKSIERKCFRQVRPFARKAGSGRKVVPKKEAANDNT